MDPLEIFNGICARESESPPNLPDVDIQLLVNANFNNTAAEDPNTSLQLRTVTDDALCPSHDLNDGQPLLDFEVIGNLSLHNNGDSQETQLDKEAIMAYLIDSKGEGLAATTGQSDPALMLPFPSSRQFHEGDPKRETTPQTTYNSEHNAHTPPSVVTQGEWKNLDSQASKNVFDPIPPSMMNGVKMVSLDQEPTNTFHSPQELPPRDTNHRADEVNLTLPINMWQSSPNPTPLILRQKSTVPFQLPITVPQTTLYTENQSLKAAKAPMKQNKRKGSKAKKGTPSSSHEIQSNENEFASSTNLTKKAMGRRKGSANAHLSLEERKKLRAERNRESAEKSRMRRKQMIIDLETNVANMRDENKDLKAKVEKYHSRLKSASAEVNRRSTEADGTSGDGVTQMPLLLEALGALQRCMDECPRTFSRNPHSPLIPLNVTRRHPLGPSN